MIDIAVHKTIKPNEPQTEDESFSIHYSSSNVYPDVTLRMDVDGKTFVAGAYKVELFDELVEEYLKVRRFIRKTSPIDG